MNEQEVTTNADDTNHAEAPASFDDSFKQASEFLSKEKEEPQADEGIPAKTEQAPAVDQSAQGQPSPDAVQKAFELAKDLSIKSGDKLSDEHLKAIERGYLREADYTRKTTEIAQMREEAQGFLQARDQILSDPSALRQHLKDEHILAAFQKEELLNIALSGVGVPPDLWARFLQEYHEFNGGQPNKEWMPQHPLEKKFAEINQKVTRFEKSFAEKQAAEQREKKEAEFKSETTTLDKEIEDTIKNVKGVSKKDVLVHLAAFGDQDSRTIAEIAKSISDEKIKDHNAYVASLRENEVKTKNAHGSGVSVPIIPANPKSFDEAFAASKEYLKNQSAV